MIIVLTGAPGAGKGTQADLLEKKDNYRKVSTGDSLRKQIKEKTEIGKLAASYMDHGNLVPDDVLLKILQAEIGNDKSEKIILDGYPRNVAQAKTLAENLSKLHPVAKAIHLDVDKNELINRLSGRRVCEKCGATYHIENSPPSKSGVCDRCGGRVSQRELMMYRRRLQFDSMYTRKIPVLCLIFIRIKVCLLVLKARGRLRKSAKDC